MYGDARRTEDQRDDGHVHDARRVPRGPEDSRGVPLAYPQVTDRLVSNENRWLGVMKMIHFYLAIINAVADSYITFLYSFTIRTLVRFKALTSTCIQGTGTL